MATEREKLQRILDGHKQQLIYSLSQAYADANCAKAALEDGQERGFHALSHVLKQDPGQYGRVIQTPQAANHIDEAARRAQAVYDTQQKLDQFKEKERTPQPTDEDKRRALGVIEKRRSALKELERDRER